MKFYWRTFQYKLRLESFDVSYIEPSPVEAKVFLGRRNISSGRLLLYNTEKLLSVFHFKGTFSSREWNLRQLDIFPGRKIGDYP